MTAPDSWRSLQYPHARALIYQQCLGTLVHELGNVTSPLALVADVLDTGRAQQMDTAASTLRLITGALSRTMTICRFLRGSPGPSSLAPATISDTAAWWLLCAPFIADMLPPTTSLRASIAPMAVPPWRYESLTWATIALTRWVAESRLDPATLVIAAADNPSRTHFDLHLTAEAARRTSVAPAARQLRQLASYELRRIGARLRIVDQEHTVVARISVPVADTITPAIVS